MAVTRFPGVDPTDQKTIERMRAAAAQAQADNAPPETLVAKGDLSDAETLGGLPCRPLSAGILAILERIKSPLVAKKGNGEDWSDREMQDAAMVALFLLLDLSRSNEELVELAWAGDQALEKAAFAWMLDIPVGEFPRLAKAFEAKFNDIGTQMEIYSGGEAEKKTVSPQIG